MRPIFIYTLSLTLIACGSKPKKVKEEVVHTPVTKTQVIDKPEKIEEKVIKEQLSGYYDEEQETDIIQSYKINDSISYYISSTNDGICNSKYLHLLNKGRSLGFSDLGKECDHDLSIPFYSSFSYKVIDSVSFMITEYISYVPKDSLDDFGEMEKSYFDYTLIEDTLIKKVIVLPDGRLKTETLKNYSIYKKPSFEKEDHEEDYNTVFLVVVDTNVNYAVLNKKMYGMKNVYSIQVDTMNRYFNDQSQKLILREDDEDELYAGDYFPRRYVSNTLSIEYLGFYMPDTKDNTLALVAGIAGSKKEAALLMKKVKPMNPNTFILEAKIFMGCMH